MSNVYEWKAMKISGKNIGIEGYNLTWTTDDMQADLKDIVTSTLGAAVMQANAWRAVNFEFDINEVSIKEGNEDSFDVIYRGNSYHLSRALIESK